LRPAGFSGGGSQLFFNPQFHAIQIITNKYVESPKSGYFGVHFKISKSPLQGR
jgi:hypothetical protein